MNIATHSLAAVEPIASESGRREAEKLEITQCLLDWSQGDSEALNRLMPAILEDLKRQAIAYLRNERPGHTLQPSALVNEVYLKLAEQRRMQWRNKGHFFAVSAQLMRRILVDYARSHRAEKRGGHVQKVQIDEALNVSIERGADLIALDEAMTELAALSPRQAQVVELRFFAGLTVSEVADVLGFHAITVNRDWRNARAWLLCRLQSEEIFRVA